MTNKQRVYDYLIKHYDRFYDLKSLMRLCNVKRMSIKQLYYILKLDNCFCLVGDEDSLNSVDVYLNEDSATVVEDLNLNE